MRRVTIANKHLLPEITMLLLEGSQVVLRAKGNSMLPFIVGGTDSVLLEKKDTFACGDIVLAEAFTQIYVLHRIIKIENDFITLMGDGNLNDVEVCKKENISGTAISIIKKNKKVNCRSKIELYKAYIWQKLLPIRRYLLAIYRRVIL